MNGVTRELMRLLHVDEATALRVQSAMDSSGIDYSECTTREFNKTARECFAALSRD